MSYSVAFSQATEIILYICIKLEEKQSKYLSIQSISEKLNIPIPSVKRLVGLLKNGGMITSKTGTSGGLMLTKNPQDISLFDIFKAVEGNKPIFKTYREFDISNFTNTQQVENLLSRVSDLLSEAEQATVEVLKRETIGSIMGCSR